MATRRMAQATALLQEHFVTTTEESLIPQDPGLARQRPLPSENFSWPVVGPVTARKILRLMMETLGKMALALAMPIALASLMVTPKGMVTALGLVLASASELSLASALASVLAMALVRPITWAMVRGARLAVLQSAASQRSCWIFPSLQELEAGLIPAPTNRRPSLR